ncbi:MAG: hypothetical protein ACJZ79_03815 [Pseudohongiellaceae bacterium]
MGPHMHYRGKAMRYELEFPDGEREVLLWVPDYDFNWQFLYEYEEPKFIPEGSKMHMSWWFDNSEGNRFNPDPNAGCCLLGQKRLTKWQTLEFIMLPTTPRGLVVGDQIPEDIINRAREEDMVRRERADLFDPAADDFSWLTEDSP